MADRYEDQYRRDRGYRRDDRGFIDRAGDQVRSWFGDDEAERRRQMDERERGQFRDRDSFAGGAGSRPGGYENRRYGQSSEYSGTYAPADRSTYDYGDRSSGSSDRSFGDADRWSGSSYGSDRASSNQSGSGSYYGSDRSTGSAYGTGSSYGPGSSTFDQGDRNRGGSWFTGRGPKGYQRSDERINEDVCDRLCDSGEVDASEIEVRVSGGEVTLTGSVSDRNQKRRAEDLIEQVSGVREVHNNLRVGQAQSDTGSSSRWSTAGGGMTGQGSAGQGSTGQGTAGQHGSTGQGGGTANVGGTGSNTEQPGNVLGVTGGAPDKASSAGGR
jgi:osmotically-inducible protein OsmY